MLIHLFFFKYIFFTYNPLINALNYIKKGLINNKGLSLRKTAPWGINKINKENYLREL
jgi:hypothetical protein